MKTTISLMGNKCPVAFVAKNKQRVKQYGDIVYLKNNDEFQLELFNPTSDKVLANIELNGKSIGSGIVIRPGERVFLDRHISEPKKFLFETYDVDGKNKDVLKAIEKNGIVKVEFYRENYKLNNFINIKNNNGNIYNFDDPWILKDPLIYKDLFPYRNVNPRIGEFYYTTGINGVNNLSYTQTSFSGNDVFNNLNNINISNSNIETGIISKGSKSDQEFIDDNSNFETNILSVSEWKILPESRKNVTVEDLVQYCVKCGRRRRPKENYCPIDGYKF